MDDLYPKCPSSTDPTPALFVAGAAAMLAGLLLGEFWNRIERIWK